jgi:hypothetical protein
MVIELLIAATVAAGSVEPPRLDVPRSGLLPHGGRACLVIDVCDPRPCVVPVQRARRVLPPPARRCGKRPLKPQPRVIPASG